MGAASLREPRAFLLAQPLIRFWFERWPNTPTHSLRPIRKGNLVPNPVQATFFNSDALGRIRGYRPFSLVARVVSPGYEGPRAIVWTERSHSRRAPPNPNSSPRHTFCQAGEKVTAT